MNADAVALQDTVSFGLFSLLATLGPLAHVVVLVILAVFGFGLWAAFGMWRRLQRETTALDKAQANSRLMQEGSTTRDPDIAEVLTADVMPADALVCKRIHDLQEMRDKDMDLQRDAFTATSAARLNLGMSVLRYVAGILILIGLVGTLTGLTQAVIGLSTYQPPPEAIGAKPEPSRDDSLYDLRTRISNIHEIVKKLLNSIEQTLSGMRTAFLASLLAIALTIVLSFCAHRLQDRLTHFLVALEDFTTKELVPLFTPPRTEAVLHPTLTPARYM